MSSNREMPLFRNKKRGHTHVYSTNPNKEVWMLMEEDKSEVVEEKKEEKPKKKKTKKKSK